MARVTLDGRAAGTSRSPRRSPPWTVQSTGAVVGIDRGVRTALVTSDGQHYRAPRISDRRAARYLALQQRMARQQKGSRSGRRPGRAMASNRGRGDRPAQAGLGGEGQHPLVRDHDVIVFEKP